MSSRNKSLSSLTCKQQCAVSEHCLFISAHAHAHAGHGLDMSPLKTKDDSINQDEHKDNLYMHGNTVGVL